MDPLFERLQSFAFDEPSAATPFTARLASANGWTVARARRVLDEYRRFLWLAMRAGHKVSPSPAVDAAWHEHLCHTRSYWDDLCGRVLGRPLHHEPSRGGAEEAAKHAAMYAQTLASYRRWFGEPPADVWPPVDRAARGVSAAQSHGRATRAVASAVAAGGLLGLAGCSTMGATTFGLAAVGLLAFVAICVVVVGGRRNAPPRSRGGEGGGCGGGGAAVGGRHDDAADGSGDGHDGGDAGGGDAGGGDGGGGCGGD